MKNNDTIMGHSVEAVLVAEVVQEKLAQLDYDTTTPAEALECCRGMGMGAFRFLDEKQGYFGRTAYCGGFTRLRQARNDPNMPLTEVLNDTEGKLAAANREAAESFKRLGDR